MGEVKLFISYSHADEAHAKRIQIHLDPLRRDGTISFWYDRCIEPGEDWRSVIESEMENADVGLLLVTPHFLASEFCQSVEVPHLLVKSEQEGILIIPVIIDYCDWNSVEWLSRINVLPRDGKPVTAFRPQSKAWTQISQELRKLVRQVTKKEPAREGLEGVREEQRTSDLLSLSRLLEELPGGTDALFGREEDLKFLDEAFQNPETCVVNLVAFGGVGKSAIVRHWLSRRNYQQNVRYIGCSFYSQGTREHAGTSDQFLINALQALGDPEPNQGPLWMRGQRLAELVAAEPTILVLDGLEPLQFGPGVEHREGQLKDVGIRELLAGLIRNPGLSLCVITSRLSLTDRVLESPHLVQRLLDVLPVQAAKELLRHRGVKGSDEELDRAADYLGRHALALVLAAEYLYTFKGGRVEYIHNIPLINEQIRAGRHAKSVMAAYEHALHRDGSLLDVEILRVIGLFDRPAAWELFNALRQPPAIPGVTDELIRATDQEIWESLSRLRQWSLATLLESGQESSIDAHPLIREYFGELLQTANKDGWRSAHGRLYEHLAQSGRELPETLDEMMPLLMGVVHACKAGRHRDAFESVYLPRIMRGEQLYAAHKLGALGSLLSVLVHFFEAGDWRRPMSSECAEVQGLDTAQQITVLTHAGMCLTAARGYAAPEVEQCYAKARDLCLGVGETRELFVALFGLWRYYLVRGDGQETKKRADRLYNLANTLSDRSISAAGERVMCTSLYYRGENALAAEHAQRGVALRQPETMLRDAVLFLNEPSISCLGYWAMSLWHLGDADQALTKIREAVSLSKELSHAHTLTISLLFDAMLSQFCRDAWGTREKAAELIRLCAQEGFSLWQIAGEVLQGWALAVLGREEIGIAQLERGLVNWQKAGATLFRVYWLALLAECYGRWRRPADGIRLLDEGLKLSEANDELWWEADLHRLKGELLLKVGAGRESEAESCFMKAREVARRQRALSLELRATISCSHLWNKLGRRQEARALLTEIYEKFSGGHDTGNLREARILLLELSSS